MTEKKACQVCGGAIRLGKIPCPRKDPKCKETHKGYRCAKCKTLYQGN